MNGQRPGSNYWMVDGVSANVGIQPSVFPRQRTCWSSRYSQCARRNDQFGVSGCSPGVSYSHSTYAPEFGCTPRGQISIVGRSGTNSFHGSIFDYLRNSDLDANEWFADASGLPKAQERQNDFGGTLGGPIAKDKAFFFFSYEGLRLRQPQDAADDGSRPCLPAECTCPPTAVF